MKYCIWIFIHPEQYSIPMFNPNSKPLLKHTYNMTNICPLHYDNAMILPTSHSTWLASCAIRARLSFAKNMYLGGMDTDPL